MRTAKVFGLVVALALVAGMFTASPSIAQARAPEVTSFDYEEDGLAAFCGPFNVRAQYTGTVKITTYFNNRDEPIRALFQGRARGSLTNTVTGYSVKDAPSIRNGFFDLVTGRQTNVGVDYHITAPGSGVVVLQAGRIIFDGVGPPTFVAGPHLGPPEAQNAALCAALNH